MHIALYMQESKQLVQGDKRDITNSKSEWTNFRYDTQTHELLGIISKTENRSKVDELRFLIGERFKVLKKEGRVSV